MDSEKCSRRRRPRTTERATVLFVAPFLALPLAAQDGRRAPADTALDDFLATVQSLSADFEQALWTPDEELLEASEGTLMLERPNRFAWHYEAPIEQRIIADGAALWTYDVELEQATVTPLAEIDQANPAMLLGGDRPLRDSFEITDVFEHDGAEWLRLEPRETSNEFRSIGLSMREGKPEILEFVDGLDQTTRIVFSNVEINPQLDPSVFEFTPPAGVDVIGTVD